MEHVDTPAGRIEYTDEGDGPVVLLLHGLLMDHTVWDPVMPLLPRGFRYIRPVLPLGAHRIPMREDADVTLRGQVQILADVLDALDLQDVTLVHSDWGGGLLLTARGLDNRVAQQVVLPCEAFDNFPPGLPGRMAALVSRLSGGPTTAARLLRVPWVSRSPFLLGRMTVRPIPAYLVRRWTEPVLVDPAVRRDLVRYARTTFDRAQLIRDTCALARFGGRALVLWSPENTVMPAEHGPRLADLMPAATYAEVSGAYVLSQLDRPDAVSAALTAFLQAAA